MGRIETDRDMLVGILFGGNGLHFLNMTCLLIHSYIKPCSHCSITTIQQPFEKHYTNN